MSVLHILRARTVLTPIAAACLLAACATGKVPTAPESPVAAPATSDESAGSRPAPAGQQAKPRPPRSDKDTKPVTPPATSTIRSGGKDVEVIVEEAPPEPPLQGPGWLSHCVSRQMQGGVILCDADKLLATPSARVKVFTRDPAAAGRMAGGSIQVRSNLPRKYRFFVVP